MKNKNNSNTRQGVRNLDSLPSKSLGRKVEIPRGAECDHSRAKLQGAHLVCSCGLSWDAAAQK